MLVLLKALCLTVLCLTVLCLMAPYPKVLFQKAL
jgi:hypothetical protein